MQLAGGIEKFRKRLSSGGGDVIGAGRPALGSESKRLHAVVAVDHLQRRVVTRDRRHQLEIEVSRQRLGLIRVEAVAETQRQQVDAGVSDREVGDIGLHLDDVADELVLRVGVETMVLAQAGGQVEPRAVDMT